MTNKQRSAVVIGASTSIGPAVIDKLRNSGLRILATSRSGSMPLIRPDGVSVACLDLSQPNSMDSFITGPVHSFGKLDLVVCLTGILPGKQLEAYDDALMNEVMTINFVGQAALIRRLLPYLSEGSQIILVSSVSAERGSFDPIYAASKAAQIGFAKSLATWLAPKTRVNVIAPALIDGSSMFLEMTPERRKHHLRSTPTGRLTSKEEVAGVIGALCSKEWENMNGQVIRLNGGMHV